MNKNQFLQIDISEIHKDLLVVEHDIEKISLSNLCKIIDYLSRIETRIYLM